MRYLAYCVSKPSGPTLVLEKQRVFAEKQRICAAIPVVFTHRTGIASSKQNLEELLTDC